MPSCDTDFWKTVLDRGWPRSACCRSISPAASPRCAQDLSELVAHASQAGLYTNLITSAVLLDDARLRTLAEAGLDHVQISIQGADAESADRIAAYDGAHEKKLEVARLVPKLGMALTLNAVVHRQNLDRLAEIINLAVASRGRAAGGGACAISWLGAGQPRGADPGRSRARPGGRHRRGAARGPARPACHRLCAARFACRPAQDLHGRLGQPVHQHRPRWPRAALPRRRDPSRA